MKNFNELSDTELMELTDEQVSAYVDLKCAEEGYELLPPPPGPAPLPHIVGKNVCAYEVGGLMFVNKADAEFIADAVSNLPQMESVWRPSSGYDTGAKPMADSEANVTKKLYYSPDVWAVSRQSIEAAKKAIEAHAAEVKAYEAIRDRRTEVQEEFTEVIEAARSRKWQRERYEGEFARYIEIANGDKVVARAFLVRAHPNAEHYIAPVGAEAVAAS